ncbi:MAG: hypothetical protein LBF63_06130 [Treponema sp.]|nr:hypothetical protein [Treponema sp.]
MNVKYPGWGFPLLLCLTLLAACPTGGEDTVIPETVTEADLTDLIPFPEAGGSRPKTIAEQAQFSGAVAWEYIFEGGDFIPAQGPGFLPDVTYRAVLSLEAKAGYTFAGLGEDHFIHRKGAASNPEGTGSSLTVAIRFPATPKEGEELVSETNLGAVVFAPYKGGTPKTTADLGQYAAAISWETVAGEPLAGTFSPSTVYKAVIVLSPKEGYTFSGLDGSSFSHPNTENIRFDLFNDTIHIVFNPTKAADETETVTLYDISALIPPPVHRQTPVWNIENDQYTGTLAWSEDGIAIDSAGTYDCEKPVQAVLTLTPKAGFTLEGVPANTFTHTGSTGISNAAGANTITLSFAAAFWAPGNISYPSLTGKTIKICCYYNGSPPTNLIDGNLTNYWDYGWSTAANNLSSWPEIMKDPVVLEGGEPGSGFTDAECTPGHPTVFLSPSMPENIRKRAHCFTLDLGAVTDNIVTFGMYSRNDDGQRWPHQIEVFYSTDTDIGPIPGDEATSLGIFDPPFPGNRVWQNVNLYEGTPGKRGFSARYIHVRIYKTRDTADPTINGDDKIDASFDEIRVGVDNG